MANSDTNLTEYESLDPDMPGAAQLLELLSEREREIAELYSNGFTNKQIAKKLSRSPSTVRNHLTAIFSKLEINNKIQLSNILRWTQVDEQEELSEESQNSELPVDDESVHNNFEQIGIAILPFQSIGGDDGQDHITYGLTENLITELTRCHNLSVIGHHSVFAFKDQVVDLISAGKALGVQYIILGSVQRCNNRVRISVQLINTPSLKQIWAEKYDRELYDIFTVQDDVVQNLAITLPGLAEGDFATRIHNKPSANISAYEYYLKGNVHCHRLSFEHNFRAREMYEKAIKLDPSFALAYAALAWTHNLDHYFVWEKVDSRITASENIRRALDLGADNSFVRTVYAYTLRREWRLDEAEVQYLKALEYNPNDPVLYVWWAEFLVSRSRSKDAIKWLEKAKQQDPSHADWHNIVLGEAYYCLKKYDKSISVIRNARLDDNYWGNALLAAALAQNNNLTEARKSAERVAGFRESAREEGRPLPFSDLEFDFTDTDDLNHFREGLSKAGLLV